MKRLLLLALLQASPAQADFTLGAVLSLTGPGAGLGIPARNTIELLPKTMAGDPVRWVVLDDGSDPTAAVHAVRKLVEEEWVDAILGPSTSPASVAGPDVIRVGGRAPGGVLLSGVPVLVVEALDDASPAKPAALAFVGAYEAKYGIGSRNLFDAMLWDSVLVLDRAAGPALATARPGTPEFHTALRNAMERVHGSAGAEGVFSLSPSDHSGAEPGSQMLIELRGGCYRLVPP